METGVLLTISSLLYMLVLGVVYFKKTKLNTLENRIFKRIIISNICGLSLHLLLFCMMIFIGTNNVYTIIISKLYLIYLIVECNNRTLLNIINDRNLLEQIRAKFFSI